jgi:hypothetical protein
MPRLGFDILAMEYIYKRDALCKRKSIFDDSQELHSFAFLLAKGRGPKPFVLRAAGRQPHRRCPLVYWYYCVKRD